ncbi:MAG: sulfatase-like hydrolase/transferase [Candidatus Sumerlaeia bacterium]|nr:sulfatase-like hydrolase/transferase [Candidatus Sumerlaeia bacterium]
MRRREWIFCVLLSVAAFVGAGVIHNYEHVAKAVALLREFREPDASLRLPATPYIIVFLRIAIFHVLIAIPIGLLLAAAAHGLVRPAGQAGIRKGVFYRTYLVLLAGVLTYLHLWAITQYPGLFKNSWQYAWFAGSSFWAFVVVQAGRVAAALLVLVLVLKYRGAIRTAVVTSRSVRAVLLGAVGAGCAIAGVVGLWPLVGRKPPANRGPNVVFIGVDSVRPDHLSALGYPRPTTPNIDAFLKDAVRFDQAFVPMARTYPSWMAILTGCYPSRNGVQFDLPPPELYHPVVPTLAQYFRHRGYSTAFFLNNTNYAWIEPTLGFDRIVQPEHNAVDFYLSHAQPSAILYYSLLNNPLGWLIEPGLRWNAAYAPLYRPELFDREVVAHWEDMKQAGAFLTVVHMCNIHVPYSVNYPYSTYFAPSFGPVSCRFTYRLLVEEIARRKQIAAIGSPAERARIFVQEINLYDALLRSNDDSVGRILDGLKHAGLYDNSLIVLLSDHGEHLFKRGLRYRYLNANHGNHLWGDEDLRIVLAIKFPQQKYAGRVVKSLVRSIDITPTLLDALDLPPIGPTDGVSLIPAIEGRATSPGLIAYAETELTTDDYFISRHLGYAFDNYFDLHYVEDLRIYKKLEHIPNLVLSKDRMVRDERWKLISYPVVGDGLTFYTELFDVTADPNNLRDVATSHPAEVKRLRAALWPHIETDWKRWAGGLPKDLPVSTGSVHVDLSRFWKANAKTSDKPAEALE